MAAKTDGIYQIKIKGNNYDLIDYDAQQKIVTLQDTVLALTTSIGSANGIAQLDSNVLVPTTQLPLDNITKYVGNYGQTSIVITENDQSLEITLADKELKNAMTLDLTFTTNVTGTGTMTIEYNGGAAKTIKVSKNGALVNFEPKDNIFIQSYHTIEVQWLQASDCWMIVGNPIVQENNGYTVYANGYILYDTLDYSELWAKGQNRPLSKILPALGDTPSDPTVAQIASALRARGNSENFKGLAIGDYFDLPSLGISSSGTSGSITWNSTYENLRFVIAGFNHYKGTGDTDSGSGILIIAKNVIFQHRMHSSDANDGGMAAMELRTKNGEGLNLATTAITNALGIAPKTVHRLLRTQTNSNPSWAWLAEQVFIPTEVEVFGAQGFGNGVWYTGTSTQYPLFAIAPQSRIAMLNGNRQWWWEATPSSNGSSGFCYCSDDGATRSASCSNAAGGVRFAFYL